MPAVRNTAALLRHLAGSSRPVPASALARALGMPRSSTYQLLKVLVDEGLVAHIPETRGYTLGVGVFELGSAYLHASPLEHLAGPILSRLTGQTGCTAQLGILHGAETLYLLKEQPPVPTTLVTGVGVRLPAHLTASGRSMLAGLPAAQVLAIFSAPSTFVDRTGVGPKNLRELQATLAEDRRRGWSIEDGAVTPGVCSIARAAVDPSGHPAASLAVSFSAEAHPPDSRGPLADAVTRAAEALTRRLR